MAKSSKNPSDAGLDDDEDTPRQMELGVFQSKNSSIVYDAGDQKIIRESQQNLPRSIAENYANKSNTHQRTGKAYSFAKAGRKTSKASNSLTKHNSTALSLKKRGDVSADNMT